MFWSETRWLFLLATASCFPVCTSQTRNNRFVPPVVTPCPVCPEAAKCPSPPPTPTQHICNCNFNAGKPDTCEKEEQKVKDKCKWQLVFKAVKGNGRTVYNDFTDDIPINENNAEAMMISSNTLPFKSSLLNDWNKMFIKQVKVDIFNNGDRKAWFLFDGTASDRTSWFAQDRLIASPYNNLKTDSFSFFSFAGKPSENLRAYINENDGPCSEDCGYLAVVDTGAERCPWARIEPKPYFLYNPNIDECCKWIDATECGDVLVDLVFVVDVSGSIDDSEFASMITFIKEIVGALPVASNQARIGAISFANNVNLGFNLNDFTDQAGVASGLDAISNTGGGTNTAAALNFLPTAFQPTNGNRPGVPDVVVVLTDGGSNDEAATLTAVANIASENYITFSIGIGSDVRQSELDAISSDPDSMFSLNADFNSLDTILDTLIGAACRVSSPVRSARGTPPSEDKIADVFAVSIKTCELDW